MSDNVIFAGQHNVYQKLRGLRVNMIDQLDCNCCWAITVAATATSDYYRRTLLRKHQLSPQDILDRVWYYYYEDVKNKKSDTAGCFQCGLRIPFELVRDKGVGFLEDYPFEAKLNEKKGPVQKLEYPRIFIEDFQMRITKLKVFEALTVETRTVIGVIDVTNEFCDYKGGIYRHPPGLRGEDFLGQHALVVEGINVEEEYVDVMNSYGTTWGLLGRGQVHVSVFKRFACPTFAFKLNQPRI